MSEVKNVLKVENATMQFGGVVAVDNLNLDVNEGEIVALIGPNGAGHHGRLRALERPHHLRRRVHRPQPPHRQDEENLQG